MLVWLKSMFHLSVGVYRLGTRRFDKAAACFSEVIRLSPDYAVAYMNRGVAFQSMNDHQRAIGDFDRAIACSLRLGPGRALAHVSRGISWKFTGDFDRAAADHMEAIALAPRLSLPHGELGTLAHFRYDFHAAVAHLDRAIRLAPRNASYYLMRGRARFDRGDFAAAETDLRYAVNIAGDPYALLFWYLACCKTGHDVAEELASRARRLNGRQWPYPLVALYLGKTDDDAVRTAAKNADDRSEAEFYIGEWHLHARRRPEAIAALQVAARSCPHWFMEHAAAVIELKRQRAPLEPDEPESERASPGTNPHEADG
jgi:lipoprotein NlpI